MLVSLSIPVLAPLLVLPAASVPALHWSHLSDDITYIIADSEQTTFDWKVLIGKILWAIYGVGVTVVLLKMLYGLSKIYTYYTRGQKEDFNGYQIITTDAVHLPFSFFKRIYISKHVPLKDHVHTILEHEQIHIRQWHTLDVLIAEIVQAFFWFNPVMIFYKRALRQAHEFLADDIICRNNSVSNYTNLLLSKSQSGLELALTNQFFHSQIKIRIQMMTTTKTNRSATWKYALVLPILIGMVVIFSSSTLKPKSDNVFSLNKDSIPNIISNSTLHGNALMPKGVSEISFEKNTAKVLLNSGVIKYYYLDNKNDELEFNNFYGNLTSTAIPTNTDKQIFRVAQQMPRLPGCEDQLSESDKKDCSNRKMFEYIYKNIKYPIDAKINGIEGKVVSQFIINTDGSVSDIQIIQDIGGGCGKAVIDLLQTMNDMPEKWIPGRQSGKNVNVVYTLPIKFKMSGDQPNTKEIPKKSDEVSVNDAKKIIGEMAIFPINENINNEIQRINISNNEMRKFIEKHLKYPSKAKDNNIEGTTYIRINLDAKGVITDAVITEDIGFGCGEEALRVVKMMPNWIPATKDGKAVSSTQTIPISFRLKTEMKN
jgi:TonB family protein